MRPRDDKADTVHLFAPPPLLYVGALALGLLLHRLRPITFLPPAVARRLGPVLIVLGFASADSALLNLWRVHTDIMTRNPTTSLVVKGPYRISRNPIYLGMTMIYGGIAVLTNALSALLLLPAVVLMIQRGAIAPEEQYLERRFGGEYLRYKARVRRWI